MTCTEVMDPFWVVVMRSWRLAGKAQPGSGWRGGRAGDFLKELGIGDNGGGYYWAMELCAN